MPRARCVPAVCSYSYRHRVAEAFTLTKIMGKLYLPVPVNPPSALPATVDALAPVSSSEARYGDHQSNLLLRQLREFVAEVLQVVDTLSAPTAAPAPATADDESGEQARQLAQEASERIEIGRAHV